MAQYFKETALALLSSYRLARSGLASIQDIDRWLMLGSLALEKADKLSHSSNLPVASKQKLQAAICMIKSVLHLLQQCRIDFQHAVTTSVFVGDGLESTESVASTSHVKPREYSDNNSQPSVTTHDVTTNPSEDLTVSWSDVNSAFRDRIKTGVITNLKHLDLNMFLTHAKRLFHAQIRETLKRHNSLKVNAILDAEYAITKNDEEILDVKHFNTKASPIYSTTNIEEWFKENVVNPVSTDMEEFQEQDSGWSLRVILNLTVNISMYNPMRAGSYIDIPEFIKKKQACVNVKNNDDQCFKWAILSALHPVKKNVNRISAYAQHEYKYNFKGITFPVDPSQVGKFEKQNDVSVNVYFLNLKNGLYEVLPRHLTAEKKEKHVNLLLVESYYVDVDADVNEKQVPRPNIPYGMHYVWIKYLSRLVYYQLSSHRSKAHICDRCLHYFRTEEKLKTHEVDCAKMNMCKIVLPSEKNKFLEFNNFKNECPVPYVVYADFESLLQPVTDSERVYQRHKPLSVGLFVKCSYDDSFSYYKSYRQTSIDDIGPATWFVQHLYSLAKHLEELYKNPQPMENLTFQETFSFLHATICHICKKPFEDKDKKVRDHCHFTGKYRGAAHNTCNIAYQESRTIPIFFHNLSGYDAHLFIKEIANEFPGRVTLIPQTKEKYISFTKYVEGTDVNLRFVDSFRFMPSSLEKLSSYLENHNILERQFQQDDGYTVQQIALLKRKGVFPYDYVSSLQNLEETNLPSKRDFYSSLYDSDITDEEYTHAENVWRTFNITDLGSYSDLYLKTDVLLLAEVFENFRVNCRIAYCLDPAHYYTTPGLSWDAMLKYTGVKLELLTDIDMLMFIERGIRGGISQCCNRYAAANNPYMEKDYNPQKADKYLMYYDINNLYGWSMTELLPHGGFTWCNIDSNFDFNVPDDSPFGYILEVDLEYPQNIHDMHKDLPFCPEHKSAPASKQKKLMTTLDDKERYVIHYRALKQAMKHGLQLKKIHRALKFDQSPWLKKYIDLNSEMRKQAKNEFEKMLFKLFNNAVYGKTMENEKKRIDVKLVNKWEGRYGGEALIARPNYHSSDIFDDNLVAIQLLRSEITVRKPIYIGLAVLDLSKTLVYRFHYDYMCNAVGERCKLLYTDTDSLVYEVINVNMYDVMRRDIHEFDTSDFDEPNQFNIPRANKKVVGLMKDENNGQIMLEFVGLRSKMYSVKVQNKNPIKKAKGVKSSVLKATITFDDYITCLRENIVLARQQKNIRSRHHQLYSERETKIALSAHDDKRFLLPGTTDTLPWGHYSIPMIEREGVEALGFAAVEPPTAVAVALATIEPPNAAVEPPTDNVIPLVPAVEPSNLEWGKEAVVGKVLYQSTPQPAELILTEKQLPTTTTSEQQQSSSDLILNQLASRKRKLIETGLTTKIPKLTD